MYELLEVIYITVPLIKSINHAGMTVFKLKFILNNKYFKIEESTKEKSIYKHVKIQGRTK